MSYISCLLPRCDPLTRFSRTRVPAALREAEASNETNSENAKPVDYSGGKTLFNTSIEWPAGVVTPIFSSASVSLDVSANVQVAISIGVVAAGTLIPPNISEFALHTGVYIRLIRLE
jgi:hypothetical protein